MPLGAFICASPPPTSRKPRPPKGLLRQASRITRLSFEFGPLHHLEHEIGLDELEVHVRGLGRIGIDRNQVIDALDLQPVAGIIEEPDRGGVQLVAEAADRLLNAGAVEIDERLPTHQREAEALQRLGDQPRIVRRIGEPRDVDVLAVADDEGDAALARLRRGPPGREECGEKNGADDDGEVPGPHKLHAALPAPRGQSRPHLEWRSVITAGARLSMRERRKRGRVRGRTAQALAAASSAATPGSSLPSSHSRKAPPAVET